MGLKLYDKDKAVYGTGSIFRSVIDGHRGGSFEEKIYLRNDDSGRWYSHLSVGVEGTIYDADGELGTSGISWKFIYGERRPTEAEWDLVHSGASVSLPDIGTIVAADTYTYHPIWVRIYIPGNSLADIIDGYSINIEYFPRLVSE